MVRTNTLFDSRNFETINPTKYNQLKLWYTLHGGPALLLRIKLTINLHIYFDCGYISASRDLICSGNGREMCEICPRSVDNLETDWGINVPHNSVI